MKKRPRKRLRRRPGDNSVTRDLASVERQLSDRKRSLREKFLERQFDAGSGDSKSCWKGLNLLLGRDSKRSPLSRVVKADATGVATTGPEIAEEFNNFFSQIGESHQRPDTSTRRSWSARTIFLAEALQPEVELLLRRLDVKKSTGPDGVSNYILKSCADELAPVITLCVNRSLQAGIFPTVLKTARVSPVHKGGSKELLSNYRAISVLSAVNKIFEQLVAVILTDFLRSQDFVYKHQHGFRRKPGTATAVVEALDFVQGHLDGRGTKVVSALSLDLKRAFDSVNHQILLQKLYAAGVRGLAHDLIADYLDQRTQFVTVGRSQSSQRPVACGVPQGSVLGPILFIIFINDMVRLGLNGKLYLFADDAILFYPGSDDSANAILMNADLRTLDVYFSQNCLSLNVSKTKCIHFRDPRKRLTRRVLVGSGGQFVEEVQVLRYLGVDIDCHLSWRIHCDQLCRRLGQTVGILYKIRRMVPSHVLKKAYFGLIHPHIMYVLMGWGTAPKTMLKRVQVLQNRALKIVMGLDRLTPTLELYSDHVNDILPVKALQIFSACKFVYQCLYGMVHHTIDFRLRGGIGNTRDCFKLDRSRCATEWGQRRIGYYGPTMFNLLPSELRTIRSAPMFFRALKHFLHRRENLEQVLRFEFPRWQVNLAGRYLVKHALVLPFSHGFYISQPAYDVAEGLLCDAVLKFCVSIVTFFFQVKVVNWGFFFSFLSFLCFRLISLFLMFFCRVAYSWIYFVFFCIYSEELS